MKKPASVFKSDLICDLENIENSKEILNLQERTGTFVDLDHDERFDKMTYQSCPDCFTKVEAWKFTGFECSKCRKLVPETHCFFFRLKFQDCSDTINVGFSRQAAESVVGMPAKEFKKLKDKEAYVKKNVMFRDAQVTIKMKEEVFKGELQKRYYGVGCCYLTTYADQSKNLLDVLRKNC